MADEIKKQEAAAENKAAEAIESAEEKARKEAEAAAKEAEKIAKKSGEEEAQKWLEGKLAAIETNLGARIAAVQTWFSEQMASLQQKIYDQTKEALAGKQKEKESSIPPNSTPATNPEKAAENSGSQSETKETKSHAPVRKRRRI